MYTIEEFDKGKTKILKYIIYKKRSENEIRNKFKKEMGEDLLEDIIEYLKEAKYIDDKEYIRRVINDFMLLKNSSIREIEYKLCNKGLKKDDIEDYVYINNEELIQYEIKSAKNIINKRINSYELEDIKQYLFRKGSKKENINKAIEEIM